MYSHCGVKRQTILNASRFINVFYNYIIMDFCFLCQNLFLSFIPIFYTYCSDKLVLQMLI